MQNNLFFANDCDIFDALMSSERRITTRILHEFLSERGIGLPSDASREELIKYISTLPSDYHFYTQIIDQISISKRKEKIKSVSISAKLSRQEKRKIFDAIKEEREAYDEKFNLLSGESGNAVIRMDYEEIDYSKTRLRQKQPRRADIEIEESGDEIIIRSPAQDKVDDIVNLFIKKTEDISETPIDISIIDFTNIPSPETRTSFFTEILNSIQGYTPIDVTKLNVYHGNSDPESITEEDLEIEEEFHGIVEKVALNGESLLSSREFRDLSSRGFYITSIRWKALKSSNNHMIEFEALFDDSRNCTDFRYNAISQHNPTTNGHTKTPRPIPEMEKKEYIKTLERVSKSVFHKLTEQPTA